MKYTLARSASLRPRKALAYLKDMSRALAVGRLALHRLCALPNKFLTI